VSSGGSITAEPPVRAAPPSAARGRARRYLVTLAFLGPAAFFLGVWVVYPAVRTVIYSFSGPDGHGWVGFDNYKSIFTTDTIVKAIENNALWIAIVPALVTAIGLVFAVLTERISWAIAFKTAVFMPMAISLFAAGVIWRVMDQKDPDHGAVNAVLKVIHDEFVPPGPLSDAFPSIDALTGSSAKGFVLRTPVEPGGVALLPLTGIPPEQVPAGAKQAVKAAPQEGSVAGTVWRDFKPGGGQIGVVEKGELGIPAVNVQLRNADGKTVGTTSSGEDGTFLFEDVESGTYRVAIGPATFRQPFEGVSWLGPKLITPALMIAYIWVWAGFAMVVIAAGLAAIPRDLLEAARTDGATEWQVFRRVTVPLLAPVLAVVFVTMLINVLKVFDIVISVAPQSVQDDANVIALAMWRISFGGANDFGVGSAIAVFLFVLVIPVLLLNVRRFRREV
jgi:alpha-glucoside transport system permease protein